MPTARDFITLAMREAGILGVGQSLLSEDVNDGFTLLNRMLAQWQKRRWLVPNLYEVSALGNGQKSNLIGPGQHYNTLRPDKIQAAYFEQLNTGDYIGAPDFSLVPNIAQGWNVNSVSNDFVQSVGSGPVSFPLRPIFSWEDYALVALKEMQSWPLYFFYDGQFPYGNVYIWPIPGPNLKIHLVLKGPIGFTTEIESGIIVEGGAGYTDGNYVQVPLVNVTGFGSGATVDITVSGGMVTVANINDSGDGYRINDFLTIDVTNFGGTGSGFTYNVTDVTDDLDAEFNMPPEYEEAIHYNLCVRLTSMYKMPADPVQGKLAILALKTLKMANMQVPTLKMPNSLRFGQNNSFYIFNADVR